MPIPLKLQHELFMLSTYGEMLLEIDLFIDVAHSHKYACDFFVLKKYHSEKELFRLRKSKNEY